MRRQTGQRRGPLLLFLSGGFHNLPGLCGLRAGLRLPPAPTPEATEEWFVCVFCMSTGPVMFALFALLPFISNTTRKFNSITPRLVSVMPLYFCTHFIYCVFFLRYVSRRRLRLRDAFYLGDAFSWRRLRLGDILP